MYESFYGFREKPFQLNPDPQFYFDSRQHRRAMAFLEYGLHQSEGFIVVTGEVGAGKTTLVRSLLGKLDEKRIVAANIVSTNLEADDSLRMVAAGFGLATKGMPKSELLLSLEARLTSYTAAGKRCLLIVDEAQNLPARAVEELRMLSNFQLGTHALLQTFLVGQPEFREILQSPEMHQLRQRVIAACHIGPLDAEDTRHYIEHRLQRVGWNGVPEVTAEACQAIHAMSGGIPRRINLVCDRLLLAGYLAEKPDFSAGMVREVGEEILGETATPSPATSLALANAGNGAAYHPQPESVDGQLEQLGRGMSNLEATLTRMERGNQDTVVMMRRFLELLRRNLANPPPK